MAVIREQVVEIGKYVRLGMSITDAARATGVNPRTLYYWLDKAKTKPQYQEIADQLENDRAKGQAALVQRIARASDEDWKAAAWMLERRHPDIWGRQDSVKLSGGLDMTVAHLSDEDLDREIEKLERGSEAN